MSADDWSVSRNSDNVFNIHSVLAVVGTPLFSVCWQNSITITKQKTFVFALFCTSSDILCSVVNMSRINFPSTRLRYFRPNSLENCRYRNLPRGLLYCLSRECISPTRRKQTLVPSLLSPFSVSSTLFPPNSSLVLFLLYLGVQYRRLRSTLG